MTTEELERDLEMLAEPREADERLRLAIRARLGDRMLRPRRRPKAGLSFGWAAVAVAADESASRAQNHQGARRAGGRGCRRRDHIVPVRAGTNTVVETPASAAPALVDPIAGVREQLALGGARVAGTATIDGKAMYKIELPTGVVAPETVLDLTRSRRRHRRSPAVACSAWI